MYTIYRHVFKVQWSRIYTLTALEILYLVFEALNSMSCVNAKLSHFSNISTILALDGANSVMSSSYINPDMKLQ